ncbi:hypothetical protein DPEC_G00314740 [Dallia pectoralis]|uniref:Uncharacterized protein n=1 Tax=Dallia pectoralis TaxID=75939 RepID=A0ACC2FC25_DALPE|nr:hypothetical protein DPEC_G00314740 [Dallia pectoralis]
MSSQSVRLFVVAVRHMCGHSLVRHTGRQPSSSCGPGVLLQRRAYSLDRGTAGQPQLQQARKDRTPPSSSLNHRNLSAVAVSVQCEPLCKYDFLDVGEVDENTQRAQSCRTTRRFIVDPALASLVTHHLGPDLEDSKAVLFECNPGPGVLTRTLLNAGAQRVVALESEKVFLPDLQALENRVDGQLEVVHCDLFKLDPLKKVVMKPPAMYSDKLFTDLGISEANWTDDVPAKVFSILTPSKERKQLWQLLYSLYEQNSIFRYGRVELNFFISECEYQKLTAKTGDALNYRAYVILWKLACHIELLHKEPWESFVSSSKIKLFIPKGRFSNDNMCLVRMTPRKDLFSSSLTTSNAPILFMMLKQLMVRKRNRLADMLNVWNLDSGPTIMKALGLSKKTKTGDVSPETYKLLFELLNTCPDFTQSWLYQETLESSWRGS